MDTTSTTTALDELKRIFHEGNIHVENGVYCIRNGVLTLIRDTDEEDFRVNFCTQLHIDRDRLLPSGSEMVLGIRVEDIEAPSAIALLKTRYLNHFSSSALDDPHLPPVTKPTLESLPTAETIPFQPDEHTISLDEPLDEDGTTPIPELPPLTLSSVFWAEVEERKINGQEVYFIPGSAFPETIEIPGREAFKASLTHYVMTARKILSKIIGKKHAGMLEELHPTHVYVAADTSDDTSAGKYSGIALDKAIGDALLANHHIKRLCPAELEDSIIEMVDKMGRREATHQGNHDYFLEVERIVRDDISHSPRAIKADNALEALKELIPDNDIEESTIAKKAVDAAGNITDINCPVYLINAQILPTSVPAKGRTVVLNGEDDIAKNYVAAMQQNIKEWLSKNGKKCGIPYNSFLVQRMNGSKPAGAKGKDTDIAIDKALVDKMFELGGLGCLDIEQLRLCMLKDKRERAF